MLLVQISLDSEILTGEPRDFFPSNYLRIFHVNFGVSFIWWLLFLSRCQFLLGRLFFSL